LAGNLLKTYLKIRIHILGSGNLERAFRAFICATGDLCRPLRAELVYGSVANGPQNLPFLGGRFLKILLAEIQVYDVNFGTIDTKYEHSALRVYYASIS
jgi:hypothetical protein